MKRLSQDMKVIVDVIIESSERALPSARWIKEVINQVLEQEKSKRRWVSVLLTDNRRIRKINKRFLKHDYPTDVISFWAKPGDLRGDESDYLGDLVVSVQMARQTAMKLKISFKEELARYLIHGTLHLLGYDDRKSGDRKKMFERQEAILKEIVQ